MASLVSEVAMLDELYCHPGWVNRPRRSWLREPIDGFLGHLAAQRYHRNTLRRYARRLLAFGEFTARHGVNDLCQLPQWQEAFATHGPAQQQAQRDKRCLVARFLRYLQQHQVLPVTVLLPPSSDAALVEEYLRFLREQRGLCHSTLERRRGLCQALVTHLASEGIQDLRATRLDSIHRFLTGQAKRYQRPALRGRCAALRDFLAFLYRREVLAVDLAAAVVSPRVYRQEQCPRFLTRTEIETLLTTIDRDTPIGRRDFAMLLVLATYGLRGSEVSRLRLDDVDWRNQLLQVPQRKAGDSAIYPLSVPVAEALIAYLRQGRPASPHREVFLTLAAPFKPLTCSAVAFRVRGYLARAGIRVARPGTHTFRYACAQRLLEQGWPLKSIGDYLGHRHPGTTQRYTMIALEQLREVARDDGEEVL
jgi:integrase/recombinase XerD